MSIKIPTLNIKGRSVEIQDTAKIVNLLTETAQQNIQKLQDDIILIDKEKMLCKKFEILSKTLKNKILPLYNNDILYSANIFNEKSANPIGMSPEAFVTYMDVKIDPEMAMSDAIISIQPQQMALSQRWQSTQFSNKVSSVTQSVGGTNAGFFTSGTINILLLNNAIQSAQQFTSNVASVVNSQFQPGQIFINNCKITLNIGDSLESICNKINQKSIGVKATAELNNNYYNLVLRSTEIGADNSILIDDPHNLLSNLTPNINGDGFFNQLPEYNPVTIQSGDSLTKIVYKINTFSKSTNLEAYVMEVTRGRYVIVLQSILPGINNAFQITDNGVLLNGTNTGAVFNNIFNSGHTIIQSPIDSIILADNIQIQRPTNNIKDIYKGIELNLKAISSTILTCEVTSDTNKIWLAIKEFVDSYNEFKQGYEFRLKEPQNKYNEPNILDNNIIIHNIFDRMKASINVLEEADIGISVGPLKVETMEDDKKVIREFQGMLIIDITKLYESIKLDYIKVQEAFGSSFNSSSDNFTKPLMDPQIYIKNKPMSAELIQIDLSINTNTITVQSLASSIFTTNSAVVSGVSSIKAGIFWLNGTAISLQNGMTLQNIVDTINSSSNMSRISAVVNNTMNGQYMMFTQYSGGFKASDDFLKFDNINIYDPSDILKNAFLTTQQINGFNTNDLNATLNSINAGGEISINGVIITLNGSTLKSLINDINNITEITQIVASSTLDQNGYSLLLDTKTKQDINILNISGFNSIVMPITPVYQSDKSIFNSSQAITGKVKVDGIQYNKTLIYSPAGNQTTSGGIITIINNDNSLKLDNIEILFIGSDSDSTKIQIKQGLAVNIFNGLNEILKQTNKVFDTILYNLDEKTSNKKQELEIKQAKLTRDKDSLTKKFTKVISTLDAQSAYTEILDLISKIQEQKK